MLVTVPASASLLRAPKIGRSLALLACLAIAALGVVDPAGADAATCGSTTMNIVAHEDDDILFMSPDLLEEVAAGDCVRTVFLTAGDDGMDATYWHEREAGSRAAYAEMAGVADAWTETTPVVDGHTVHLFSLDAQPQISEVFLRLPDGGFTGSGFESTGFQSLPRLWRSQHSSPTGLSPISRIDAIDGSATYTYEGLVGTLEALIAEYGPSVIGVQNFAATFSGGGDHADHIAGARFAHLAAASDGTEHVLRSFVDYETKNSPENVFEPQLQKKLDAYFAYAAHDSAEACTSQAECEAELPSYWKWLHRQYVASESTAPGIGQPTREDLALHRSASASSSEEPEYGAGNANDGDPATRWISDAGDDQWWQVDLGTVQQVDEVRIDWAIAYGSKYLIQTSTDGGTFTTAAEMTAPGAGITAATFAPRSARYVRVQGVERGTPWGYSFWSAEVFGQPLEPDKQASKTETAAASAEATTPPDPASVGAPVRVDPVPGCKVPKLKGKNLKDARKNLAEAGCKLGKVTRKKGVTSRTGRVIRQGRRPGKNLPGGARVSARLG